MNRLLNGGTTTITTTDTKKKINTTQKTNPATIISGQTEQVTPIHRCHQYFTTSCGRSNCNLSNNSRSISRRHHHSGYNSFSLRLINIFIYFILILCIDCDKYNGITTTTVSTAIVDHEYDEIETVFNEIELITNNRSIINQPTLVNCLCSDQRRNKIGDKMLNIQKSSSDGLEQLNKCYLCQINVKSSKKFIRNIYSNVEELTGDKNFDDEDDDSDKNHKINSKELKNEINRFRRALNKHNKQIDEISTTTTKNDINKVNNLKISSSSLSTTSHNGSNHDDILITKPSNPLNSISDNGYPPVVSRTSTPTSLSTTLMTSIEIIDDYSPRSVASDGDGGGGGGSGVVSGGVGSSILITGNSDETNYMINNNNMAYLENNLENSSIATMAEDGNGGHGGHGGAGGSEIDTSTIPPNISECLSEEHENCILNGTFKPCMGDISYCNMTYDEYMTNLYEYIYPSIPEWILIFSHAVVFFMGLVGNALVCIAVYTNYTMRTVTNIFIVNLAVADFFVILFCLPPTVVWDVTETWFLGSAMCKVVLYFQTVSVTVSVLTLTFISIDRWYAICFPLRYVSTNVRAIGSIAFIWVVALISDIPEFIYNTTVKTDLRYDLVLFTQCICAWEEETEKLFIIARFILLYILPLLMMTVAYFQIVRVLWKSDTIPGHRESRNTTYTCGYLRSSGPAANSSTMGQLRARRKAAKMLVAVVVMFASCFFPVHVLSILRCTIDIKQNNVITVLSLFSHWLCYANSAINPLIYNFMSGKFRREFRNALERCRCSRVRVEDRSFYHSTPASRVNNISPSSRSNYQLTSLRDMTSLRDRQTMQTSFLENGNNNTNGHQNHLHHHHHHHHHYNPAGSGVSSGIGHQSNNTLTPILSSNENRLNLNYKNDQIA